MGYKVFREDNPDAGQYEPNLGKEGREIGNIRQKINMGSKWETIYNENPPPGYYNPEEGDNLTKHRSSSAWIKEPRFGGFKVYREDNPDAGQYEPNKGKEGREMGNLR